MTTDTKLAEVMALVDACEGNTFDGEYALEPEYKAARTALESAVAGILSDLAAAQAELQTRNKSPSDRLHNLCRAIEEEADGSEWSREEWHRIDAETVRLKNELRAAQADTRLLRDAMRRLEVAHTGMTYGDEKRGGPTEYTRGWGDCLAGLKAAIAQGAANAQG